ncbi:hypothetical protein VHEMI06597 [[Torrubiella] hemipterigena]|uniref:Nup53p-like protein n=1 Tax=[Torrubiella] hemipterigena TaxID=1531966 RepID=A0A0A1TJU5_9HYPO|nr:hypothetical protein VHEMI06597 [[Torrubiella] hemipterigena]
MAPLILHNVPDDECYVGDDGVKRPYAMIFNQNDGGSTRSRRAVAETGSFGKSTRRARSRTGTPARGTKENPTLAAADKLFGDWVNNQATTPTNSTSQRKAGAQDDPAPQRAFQSTPVELILRGYRNANQQYAAISHYEDLAGLILEDYPRDPPSTQRRYKSDLRDPAFTRRRNLSPEERALVNHADGGEHWVKITFESTEAGNAAIYSSPQRILGHLVYAEPYRGMAPAKDEPCPDVEFFQESHFERSQSMPAGLGSFGTPKKHSSAGLPSSFSSRLLDLNSPDTRSETLDTATMSPSRASTIGPSDPWPSLSSPPSHSTAVEPMSIETEQQDGAYCRRIPTARRARLLPAEQALLPQQSVMQRVVGAVPFIKWFSGSMIGNEVPRMESGEFDWNRASLYWKIIWWLDATFGLFKGDVCSVDKDD